MELLERAAYLDQLGTFLGEAAAGHGLLVFVGGEAGVGKSALVQQFTRSAAVGARVLEGVCDAFSTPRPLGPLADIAAAVGGELERQLEHGGRRERVFDAFLAELGSGPRPTLIIFEDVHWADEATLDLLRFVGRRVHATRALLVATYRDDEVGPSHPLRIVMGDLATSTFGRLALGPLSLMSVTKLAEGSRLDPGGLHHRTGGNPFFVTEVLASGSSGIPANVRDAVLARVARLSRSARAALETAAVIGSRIEPSLLVEFSDFGAQAVDECLGLGVLRPDGDTLAFRHELGREAVLESLSPLRRQALSRRVLDVLRSRPIGPDDYAILAHHADCSGDGDAVLAYAPAAARSASSRWAHREAAAQYARAVRFADRLPPDQRALLLEGRAHECYLTASWRESKRARLRSRSGVR